MKRLLPLLAFAAIALVGTIAAAVVWFANDRAEKLAFEAVTGEATNRIRARLGRHLLLIEATAAFFEAQSGRADAETFKRFFDELNLERNTGIASLGYAAFASRAERSSLAQAFEEINSTPLKVWPDAGLEYCACVLLFEGVSEFGPISGYDAYTESARRQAIDRAIADRAPRATGPVDLVRDSRAPEPGFLIYDPVYTGNFGIPRREGPSPLPTGLVFGGFGIAELVEAVLGIPPFPPVELTVLSSSDPGQPLYRYGEPAAQRWFAPKLDVTHRIQFAGQELLLAFRPTAGFRPLSVRPLTLLLALSSLLLGLAAAALLREQARARQSAERLAETTQQSLMQKDLTLQEMKHRIKNAISRILAIARQTAARSDDVESFTATFIDRLQAMSNAQDLLTRSRWQRADLRELVNQELYQVFGADCDAATVTGPKVEIDEKTAQALGLTFHELATNAMKYGGAAEGVPEIAVSWEILRDRGKETLRIDWSESGGSGIVAPTVTGFGTRLIDANVRHDLCGSVERTYRSGGLHMRLTVPLPAPQA